MIQRHWAREQLLAGQMGKWCGEGPDDGANRGASVGKTQANRSHWKPKMGGNGGLCGRYGPTPGRSSAEGDQALQVLDDGAQGELTLHSSEASSPGSREPVLILALGEEVLASASG